MNKQEIRRAYLKKRSSLSAETVRRWSEAIEKHILQFVCENNFQVILAYAAFRNEPETLHLLETLLAQGKTVALPKCGKNGQMTMYRVTDISSLQEGAYGILEPAKGEIILPEESELVLVPGCAFSRENERLGYGGGYYDRYLPACAEAVLVGICYEMCMADALPVDAFDVTMDYIITEKGLVNKV
ncbi:MAG: 5-formyltetrahydrofolate cyclo-ligase [Clostridia bacterium]|nr:5-formyltetrahydrofolate cyclo-ligase [Clostridia bacterium]